MGKPGFYNQYWRKKRGRPLGKIELMRYQKILAQIKRHTSINENFRVLDIGCGEGRFLGVLPLRYKFGVDISEIAVKMAKKKGIAAQVVDVEHEKLPYESNYFDLITCTELLEHLFDASLLLSEIRRVLKPGASVYVTVPNDIYRLPSRLAILAGKYFFRQTPYAAAHIRFFKKNLLKDLFLEHGFEIIYVGGVPLSYKGLKLPLGEFLATHLTDMLVVHYSLLARKS